jgi:hypothetical protein
MPGSPPRCARFCGPNHPVQRAAAQTSALQFGGSATLADDRVIVKPTVGGWSSTMLADWGGHGNEVIHATRYTRNSAYVRVTSGRTTVPGCVFPS